MAKRKSSKNSKSRAKSPNKKLLLGAVGILIVLGAIGFFFLSGEGNTFGQAITSSYGPNKLNFDAPQRFNSVAVTFCGQQSGKGSTGGTYVPTVWVYDASGKEVKKVTLGMLKFGRKRTCNPITQVNLGGAIGNRVEASYTSPGKHLAFGSYDINNAQSKIEPWTGTIFVEGVSPNSLNVYVDGVLVYYPTYQTGVSNTLGLKLIPFASGQLSIANVKPGTHTVKLSDPKGLYEDYSQSGKIGAYYPDPVQFTVKVSDMKKSVSKLPVNPTPPIGSGNYAGSVNQTTNSTGR